MGATWCTGQGLAHRPERTPCTLWGAQPSDRPSGAVLPRALKSTRFLRVPARGASQVSRAPRRAAAGWEFKSHRRRFAASGGDAGHHAALAAGAVAPSQPDGSSVARREAERLREPTGGEHREAGRTRPPLPAASPSAIALAQGRRAVPTVLAPVGAVKILLPSYLGPPRSSRGRWIFRPPSHRVLPP